MSTQEVIYYQKRRKRAQRFIKRWTAKLEERLAPYHADVIECDKKIDELQIPLFSGLNDLADRELPPVKNQQTRT